MPNLPNLPSPLSPLSLPTGSQRTKPKPPTPPKTAPFRSAAATPTPTPRRRGPGGEDADAAEVVETVVAGEVLGAGAGAADVPREWGRGGGGEGEGVDFVAVLGGSFEARFPRMEKMVTLQCSGTRRIEQINLYAGEGDEMINAPWAEGAIGTANYVGISLKKVIKACGGLVDDGKHLEFYGADTYFKKNNVMNYLVSVPWSKVKANEVMLAWEMNGEPLPKIHGYPLRVIVMGYIGARSVKWLYRIKAIDTPSLAPVQSQEYLYFNQQVGKHNQLMTSGIQIQEMPVSSAIMSPWTKQIVIHNGAIHCKGWAYSGGGRWPERVELSADGGFSWYAVAQDALSHKKKFAWRTWEIDLPCDVEGWIEIVCRCWDNSLNTQPLNVRAAWNWGLHVTSSAHRISIYSVNKTREITARRLQDFDDRGVSFAPLTVPTEWPIQSMDDYVKYFKLHGPRDAENEYDPKDLAEE
ncbi:hypothetical protein LTR29_017693 [Friedmanniomyces endolithicus]|nr:hypothetical protein LTR29_017693 [Friedmanniomyces endolithicus]